MILLLSVAIAPAIALFSYFYLRNQLATEPRNLLQALIYGAALTFPILFIQYVFQEEHIFPHPIIQEVLFSGVIEEGFKWIIILMIIFPHIEFDDPYDGILYGVAVSLGFAAVENVLYLLSEGVQEAFLRAILPVSGHALFGVVMGYYFGKAKFSTSQGRKRWLCMALLIPLFLHICFNGLLTLEGNYMYLMIPFMLFLWWFGLHKTKKAYRALEVIVSKKNHLR